MGFRGYSRPNEFFAAIYAPCKGWNVKGAKRHANACEPLIFQALQGIIQAAMDLWVGLLKE